MKITVIGSGNMGSALIRHLAKKHEVIICNRGEERGRLLAKETGSSFMQDPCQAVEGAKWVLLAVKPKDLSELADVLSGSLTSSHHLLSILAGTKISSLKNFFPDSPVVRLMPNLAITIGKGIIGFSAEDLSQEVKKEAEEFFVGLGQLIWIPESKMEAFSSLAASSPAFVLTFMEAMIEAGIHSGFSVAQSRDVVIDVLEGTAAMLKASGKSPQELKWQITSPGGTTIAGLKALEATSFRAGIWNAIEATYEKALQMSEE